MNSTASTRTIGPRLTWAVTTAMAGVLLSGCTTHAAPPSARSASKAEEALTKGNHDQAVTHAEAAVLAEPRNAAYRAMLGSAYLDAGRFASAETTFDDAMQLGDDSPRTALSLALALIGQGKQGEAATVLDAREGEIAAADFGLALALAGQADRGVRLMGDAIRAGQNNAKLRQNLAYGYALAGRWREARIMAAQDVPPDQLARRMEQWVLLAHPEAAQRRVAALLQVPAEVYDAGQPAQLALANNPSIEQLAVEASALVADQPAEAATLAVAETPLVAAAPARPVELPPVAPAAVAEPARPNDFQRAFAAVAEPVATAVAAVAQDALSFISAPVVQPMPVREEAPRAPVAMASAAVAARPSAPAAPQRTAERSVQRADGTHLVQLGSFGSEQTARRAWSIYAKNYPELAGHKMVISQAVVKGKRYWRVSAGGFDKPGSSAMCGKVKASGQGCFAYSESRPLPGAVDNGVRLARR